MIILLCKNSYDRHNIFCKFPIFYYGFENGGTGGDYKGIGGGHPIYLPNFFTVFRC